MLTKHHVGGWIVYSCYRVDDVRNVPDAFILLQQTSVVKFAPGKRPSQAQLLRGLSIKDGELNAVKLVRSVFHMVHH